MALGNMKSVIIIMLLFANLLMAVDTTLEMVKKADRKIDELKKHMKEKCEEFHLTLDEKGQTLFKDEQSSWLELVSAKAEFAADKYRGGSLAKGGKTAICNRTI